jgi:hypothetical protein
MLLLESELCLDLINLNTHRPECTMNVELITHTKYQSATVWADLDLCQPMSAFE